MKPEWLFVRRAVLLSLTVLILQLTTQAQLHADFTANPTSGCAPVFISFQDASTGNPTGWKWDLGNGAISFLQNPSTTYFNPGQYTIKLVVKNALGSDSLVKTSYITINALPKPLFAASDTMGCYPLTVHFSDLTLPQQGNIVKWEWDLGDGAVSNLQNPSHVYTAAGNYNVILKTTNSAGCVNTLSKAQYIKITNGVKADFSFVNSSLCKLPANVNFINNSNGTGSLSYQWSFGDGKTSSATNPSNAYTSQGTYTAQLIVTNNIGCKDTLTKKDSVIIGQSKASFTAPDSICKDASFQINNTSMPATGNVVWNFGDGSTSNTVSPVKIYNGAGSYTINLVANFGGCKDSTSHVIKVLPKPVVNFTASQTAACKAPVTIQFKNLSAGGVSYLWNFGDNTSSTLLSPVHTYLQNGNYTVTLLVTNSNGCTDSLVQSNLINIQAPDIILNSIPAIGCAPLNFTPVYTVNAVVPITAYSWDFGDGSGSLLANPSHTYSIPGTYTISLTYTTADGCTGTFTYPNAVRAGQKPVANFSATPTDACAAIPIQFTDHSTGTISSWNWQFGDGGVDTGRNPLHLYGDTGYFNVQLIAGNNGCMDTLTLKKLVHIKPPIARFSTSSNCTSPFTYTFKDQSLGALTWFWDFGDGTNSNATNPTHVYTSLGSYNVTLTVSNGGCTHTSSMLARVIVEKANFYASDSVICRGKNIIFNPSGFNTGNIMTYQWNFGDGTGSTQSNPSKTYTSSGIYKITLIITNVLGCSDTLSKTNYIIVNGPVANFNAANASACLNTGGMIQFNDASTTDGTHAIKNWQLNFGDGTIQNYTTPAFSHHYNTPGYFTAGLVIRDTLGCVDSISKINLVYISNPRAAFFSADTMSCSNKPINFFNQSSGPALNYTWSFGDAANSSLQNPVHNYANIGVYDIGLKITDSYGCQDSVFKARYIHIENPKALFTVSDSFSTCPPLVVNFGNQSKYYNQLSWDFGDGTGALVNTPVHYYNYPGVYYAKLLVTSPGGCTDTFSKRIEIQGPTGTFSYDKTISCNPAQVGFTAITQNTASLIWDFNDGSTIKTTDTSLSHSYTSLGIYVPRIILQDAQGCKVPILGKDTIRVFGVTSLFSNNKSVLCDSGMVSFTDASLSNDLITQYQWQLGDGSSALTNNTDHLFSTAGIYPVKLIVTTLNGCKDTSAQITNIKVVSSPQVTIRSDSAACAPANINFFGDITVADTSAFVWNWNLGNNYNAAIQNPGSYLYQQAGSYSIAMTATNSTGCQTTRTKQLTINPVPQVDAGSNTVICQNRTATLQATGASTYSWSPATAISCTICASPVVSPDSNITYYVKGESIFGCKAADSVIIRVKHPFSMKVGAGDTLCKGESYRLLANNAELYNWTPSLGLDKNSGSSVLARPDQTTVYQVVGRDSVGCYFDTGFVKIIVYPFPSIDAGADQTISVGSSVELNTKISADATSIQWQPSVGLSCSNCPNPIANPKQTTAYQVSVTNQGGCINKDEVTVFVVCNNGNIFLPNTFSPNGDGNNDVFYPRGKGLYNIRMMRIFNRWGEPVYEVNNFQANDASKGWNGMYKNKQAPNDVYVYFVEVICENNTVLTYSGNIALIR